MKRRGQLDRADAEAQVAALVLLLQALAPFAPHAAEELLIASGREDARELFESWPDSATIPVAAESGAPPSRARQRGRYIRWLRSPSIG